MNTIRLITQWFGYIVSHAYLKVLFTKQIYSGPLKATCIPFVTCHACPIAVFSCPIGTIQHYVIIRQIPFVLMGHLGLILVAVGRMVCGWLCPLGLLQDMAYKINSKKVKIPKYFDYFKYFTLAGLVLFFTYISGQAWFCRLCPMGTLEAAIPWIIWNPTNPVFLQPTIDLSTMGWFFVIKIIILKIFIVWIIISKRPFCRAICPLALIFAPFNRISLLKMEVNDQSACDNCNYCKKLCPMDIKISDNPDSGECIRCLECTKCKKVKVGLGNLQELIGRPWKKIAEQLVTKNEDR